MTNETLAELTAHIEELEKRIKALTFAFTTTSQITSIQAILKEVKNLISIYKGELQNFESTQNTKVENISSKVDTSISQINSTVSSIDNTAKEAHSIANQVDDKVNQTNNTVTTIERLTTELSKRVDKMEKDIEQGGTSGGGGEAGGGCNCNDVETTNWYDSFLYSLNFYKNGAYETPLIYFSCEPTEKVKIKFTAKGSNPSHYSSSWLNIVINDSITTNKEITMPGGDVTHVMEVEFFPTEKMNKCLFGAFFGDNEGTYYSEFFIEIEGRNISILNRDEDLFVFPFNNKIYITKQRQNNIEFFVQDSTSIDLSSPTYTFVKNPNNESSSHEQMLPKIKESSTNPEFVELEGGYKYVSNNSFNGSLEGDVDVVGLTYTPTSNISINSSSINIYNNPRELEFDKVLANVYDMISLYGTGPKNDKTDRPVGRVWFKYKSKNILGAKDCVGSNYMGTTDALKKNVISQYVVLHNDGMQVFYPKYNADYCIKLCKGTNAVLYREEDESVNVYITRFNCVYRFYLTKNVEGKYEITEKYKYKGVTKILEVYNGNAIVKKDGVYSVETIDSLNHEII